MRKERGAFHSPAVGAWLVLASLFRGLQAGAGRCGGWGVAAKRPGPCPSHPFPSPGECSPSQLEAIKTLHPEWLIGCHLQFKDDDSYFPARDVFMAEPGFDAARGEFARVCV